ncbi:MAG: hypothetical protein L6R37_006220 [Teloschistes peruensis]|nr:MAG: hypothetical protein L6R37_006220 [Teloschistes peruensis]
MATLHRVAKDADTRKRDLFEPLLTSIQADGAPDKMVSWFTSPFKNPLKNRHSIDAGTSRTYLQSFDGTFEKDKLSPNTVAIPNHSILPTSEIHPDTSHRPSDAGSGPGIAPLRNGSSNPSRLSRTAPALNGTYDDGPAAVGMSADVSDGTSRLGSTPSKLSAPSSHTSVSQSFVKREPAEDENVLHTLSTRLPSSSSLSSQLTPAKSTTPNIEPVQPRTSPKPSINSPRASRISFNNLRPRSSIPTSLAPAELAQQSIHAAYSSRLNPFALHQNELYLLRTRISHLHVTAYLNIRNRILRLWVRNPLVGVTPEEAAGCAASSRWLGLAEVAYEWLLRNGYINFGCVEVPDTSHIKVRKSKNKQSKQKTIVVIGAGIAGLGCARQLESLFRQYHYRLALLGEEPPKVIVLEGRNRIGGRVYSHPLNNQTSVRIPEYARCTAELGAHIITGFDHGNPLNMIIRGQLALHYHALRDNSTLYDLDGRLVDKKQDTMVEKLYNDILDRASVYRHRPDASTIVSGDKTLIEAARDPQGEADAMISTSGTSRTEESARAVSDQLENVPGGMDKLTGKAHMVTGSRKKAAPTLAAEAMGWNLSSNVLASRDLNLDPVARGMENPTLGAAMDEAVKQYQFLLDLEPQHMRLINWHYANMEYANAVNLGKLSLSGWDQDIGNEFEGEHTQVIGGYQQVPRGILQYPSPLDLRTQKTVKRISYDPNGRRGRLARIHCDDGQVFEADRIVLTTSLGVLKEQTLAFDPPLPRWKLEPIERLGFGVLNKLVLVYEKPFWNVDQDMFGLLRDSDNPGSLDQEDYVKNRGKFYLFWNCIKTSGRPVLIALMAGDAAVQAESASDNELINGVTADLRRMFKGTHVPRPSETIVTRWRKDPFTRGTYSYVGATSLPDDYDIMARSVGNLHFAGEATCGTHPATVHGAYISGLRAASEIMEELLGPIELPTPLVPPSIKTESSPKSTGQKRKAEEAPASVSESAAAKAARLDAIEQEILATIIAEIGFQPSKAGSKKGSNPYLLFTTDKWEECKEGVNTNRRVATGNANAKGNKNDIRAAVGALWRQASEETKQQYREKTVGNRLTNSENAATFDARLASWNDRAVEIRRKYLEDHPGALSMEEQEAMWTALGIYEHGRKAKRKSGYADRTVKTEETG